MYSRPAVLLALLLILPLLAREGRAQEAPQAQRYENVTWHRIDYVRYEPGSQGRALEIIRDYFIPAAEQAGLTAPMLVEMTTGEWDVMTIWTLDGGVSDLEWEVSPEGVAFQQAMAELHGADRARALGEEYESLVAAGMTHLGLRR